MAAEVVGTGEAQPDGSQALYIALEPGSDPIEVNVPLHHLEQLIERFQLAAMARVQAVAKNIAYPVLAAREVHTAHSGPETQLLVATEETGLMVLEASDDLLRQMKVEIDKVLAFRGGSTSKN